MLMTVLKGELATKQSIEYRFQLNKEELNSVMSKKSTSPKNLFSGQNGGTRKLPHIDFN